MSVKLVSNEKIAETSSKGNQEKWYDKDTNLWYKLDQFGYEALSETVISEILAKCKLQFPFVKYNMEKLNVHGREITGCSSANFLQKNENIITISKLLGSHLNISLVKKLSAMTSDKKRLKYICETTEAITGLEKFGEYLTLLFEIDALFLNDDRHLNNIAVIEKNGKFDYCPIFDNGAGLLSNVQIYRMDINPSAHIKTMRARPLNSNFIRQVNAMRSMYSRQLEFEKLSENNIIKLLNSKLDYYAKRDRGLIIDRVACCILTQQKKLFLY